MTDRNRVDQRGVHAERVIGRDSIEYVQPRATHVEKLVELLEREMERGDRRDGLIESLEFFEEPISPDGVTGLEDKLKKAGREGSTLMALRYKEMFAKFLTRYSLYQAAQELIALCLHRVVHEFEVNIHPVCAEGDCGMIDRLVAEKVVVPVLEEYASGTFSLNHGLAQGMIYWLADRCFVRWHAA